LYSRKSATWFATQWQFSVAFTPTSPRAKFAQVY
jgi:hypothetical protein